MHSSAEYQRIAWITKYTKMFRCLKNLRTVWLFKNSIFKPVRLGFEIEKWTFAQPLHIFFISVAAFPPSKKVECNHVANKINPDCFPPSLPYPLHSLFPVQYLSVSVSTRDAFSKIAKKNTENTFLQNCFEHKIQDFWISSHKILNAQLTFKGSNLMHRSLKNMTLVKTVAEFTARNSGPAVTHRFVIKLNDSNFLIRVRKL